MTLEEAIKTALDYEVRVRDIYIDAIERVADPAGKQILEMLRDDEQYHIEYLKERLQLWKKTGKLSDKKLETIIPSAETIQRGMETVQAHMSQEVRFGETEVLGKALQAEVEASKFYQKMVDELSDEGQRMFAQFIEIEENHIAAVQAELDYVTKSGYWFNFKEFDMEEL
jgi:rubrerythrin